MFMSGFSLSMLKVFKIKSIVQFLAVPSILGLAKSILRLKFSKRWSVTSMFLYFLELGLCLLSANFWQVYDNWPQEN